MSSTVSSSQSDPPDLSALPWSGDFVISGYGTRIGVRFTDSELGARLAERPSPGAHLAGPGPVDRTLSVFHRDGRYWIFADDEMMCQPALRDDLLDAFDTHLRAALAAHSPSYLFVHSGAVGWKGRAVILPGRSLAGKTSLVAALVRAGATYLSDEYAVVDATGQVHPFAKPLSLRASPSSRQLETPVESLGGIAATDPLPVGLVVLTDYRDGAVFRPEAVSRSEGALFLMDNTIAARRWPALAVSTVATIVEKARVFRSPRGEASDCAATIIGLLDHG